MKVAILIPTYNREKYIIETIESCLNQSHDDIDIIIYDDGSTDNTYDVVQKFIKSKSVEIQKKMQYARNKHNHGIGYSRGMLLNLVKSASDSEYACWLDSDDLMHENRIKDTLNYLTENELDIVYCNLGRFNKTQHGKVFPISTIKADVSKYEKYNFKSLKNNTTCASALFNTNVMDIKFSLELALGGEDVLWLYQILNAGLKIGHLNETLYYYRSHQDRIGLFKQLPENREEKMFENEAVGAYLKKIEDENS